MLCRHMQIVAHRRQVADGRDQVVGHVARVVGHELDPVEAVDRVEEREQIGEPRRLASVGEAVAVDGLADECDFAAALGHELPRLGDDRGRCASLLGAADVRHNTEGTELVAAGLRPNERLEGRRPHLRIAVGVVALEALGDRLAAAAGAVEAHLQPGATAGEHVIDEAGHAVELARTDDEIDPGRPLADEFLILLGHAAEHADHEARTLLLFEADPAERGVDLVLRMLPHAAGVVEDGVGLGGGVGQLPALPAQRGDDELAVEHVHLAADRFDPEPFRHGTQCIQPPIAAPGWKCSAGMADAYAQSPSDST